MTGQNMSTTDIVAWWGAVLATIVFLWDIYKYKAAGPRLRFTVQTGMAIFNDPRYEGQTLVFANVINYGDRPTTIRNLCYFYFEKRRLLRELLRRKPDGKFIVLNQNHDQQLPYELKPGTEWRGFGIQDAGVEKMAQTGVLEMVVYHTHSNKPVRQRVVIHRRSGQG
jgi:hypothetical protein